jgi:hypothetical protein
VRYSAWVRGKASLFAIGVGLLALLTRCTHDDDECAVGAPCTEAQVGRVCGGSECTNFVCDGVEYGPVPKAHGDPCDPGTLCSSAKDPVCDPGALVCQSIAPDANVLFEGKNGIATGQPCSTKGKLCPNAGFEKCDSCTCDGVTWSCGTTNCNDVDAGTCPSPYAVIPSDPCDVQLTCPSGHACGISTNVFAYCTCTSSMWSCNVSCDDAGDDASDAATE